MARVVAGSECWPYTGGASEFEVEAGTVREIIAALDARFPGLGAFVDKRMAFAIDGEIHQDAWFSPVGPDSEVFLIPKIGGG
ncbi:MAG: MoaD/ThiS family protein [Phenylobacterium sp.]|uniref:MoaD/ThiS family protein n=1 Tax=Phenylobacterium sp. TaxID=1871053 RepID=UPI001A5D4409|nr:MoaD/ThiS family protein [Phenylobacterium sp.]MBL8770527.1 MoaD/ThiS family protein [Phenylobacterium sp.]